MPDFINAPLLAVTRYNPHLWGEQELRNIFVTRLRELSDITGRIRAIQKGRVPQHLLITGHRGMGKTTLLRRVALAVADDEQLHKDWIALTFPEEQYTVSTLAELFSNMLDALVDALEREGADQRELDRLDARIQQIQTLEPKQREEAALALIDGWMVERDRRILLLIDSSDLLFEGLAKANSGGKTGGKNTASATALWRLRKTLSHHSGLFWLGASYQALESDDPYGDAFHDFFELVELRPLSLEDMEQSMLALARTFGATPDKTADQAEAKMRRTLSANPGRLKALRAITGGNPRTTVILYDLFASGWDGNVHSDLKALLDVMTPLYKARMEHLAEQPRKILAHILEYWAPIPVRELARISGIPNTTISSQLSRLEAEGLVEKAELPGTKRSGYQASERFFNIWYLMRTSPRRVRQRLTWLVEFMRLWFSGDELHQLARRHHQTLSNAASIHSEGLEFGLAMSDALPRDAPERHQLEWSVFTAARRLADRQRKSLRDAMPELFDGSDAWQGFVAADDYLHRFEALDGQLRQCPHLKDEEQVQEWLELVKGSLTMSLPQKEQVAERAIAADLEPFEKIRAGLRQDAKFWVQALQPETMSLLHTRVMAGDFFPDCPDAQVACQQILGHFAQDTPALAVAVQLMARNHGGEWVEKHCRLWTELDETDVRSWNNLGNLLQVHLSRYEESEMAYRRAIELDESDASSWNNLGCLLQDHLGRYEESEMAYRQAIELDESDARPWNNLGGLLQVHLGHYEDSEAAYRRAIELDENDALLWINLGTLLQDHLGRYEDSEAAYRRAIELDENDARPWNNLGYLLQDHLGRYEDSEKAYRQAIELDENDARPWYNLGNLLQDHLGRYQDSEAAYRRAIELDENHARPWNNLGILLQDHLSRYEDSEAAYRRAIELDENYASPWNNLGNLLQDHLGRYQDSEKAYRRAIELDENYAHPWNNLGNLLQDHLSRVDEAEQAMRQAMALDASDPYTLVNLARLLVTRGGSSEEVNQLYRDAARLAVPLAGTREGEQYFNLLLQAHLWLGNRDEATQALSRITDAAMDGGEDALFRIKEQCRECHSIGRGLSLAELMEASPQADFLRPFALALRAGNGDGEALKGVAEELRTMAEEVLADLRRVPGVV